MAYKGLRLLVERVGLSYKILNTQSNQQLSSFVNEKW